MKHGGECERRRSGVQGAGASAHDSVEEESGGELEDITDDDGCRVQPRMTSRTLMRTLGNRYGGVATTTTWR